MHELERVERLLFEVIEELRSLRREHQHLRLVQEQILVTEARILESLEPSIFYPASTSASISVS